MIRIVELDNDLERLRDKEIRFSPLIIDDVS